MRVCVVCNQEFVLHPICHYFNIEGQPLHGRCTSNVLYYVTLVIYENILAIADMNRGREVIFRAWFDRNENLKEHFCKDSETRELFHKVFKTCGAAGKLP